MTTDKIPMTNVFYAVKHVKRKAVEIGVQFDNPECRELLTELSVMSGKIFAECHELSLFPIDFKFRRNNGSSFSLVVTAVDKDHYNAVSGTP